MGRFDFLPTAAEVAELRKGKPITKPRPAALLKKDRAKRKESIEERENRKVKARSKGQCEVRERYSDSIVPYRCMRAAREIHHFLGGMGRRGIKESALAENKLHVCSIDHKLITKHVLQPHWTDVNDRAGTVTFVRIK